MLVLASRTRTTWFSRLLLTGFANAAVGITALIKTAAINTMRIMVSFLGEEGGYRAAAARFDLAWQLLWAWVEALANKAKAILAALAGLTLRYPGLADGSPLLPSARDLDALGARARSPAKRESLATIGVLLVTGYRLWGAGWALGLPWGRPDPAEALAFLARLEAALA